MTACIGAPASACESPGSEIEMADGGLAWGPFDPAPDVRLMMADVSRSRASRVPGFGERGGRSRPHLNLFRLFPYLNSRLGSLFAVLFCSNLPLWLNSSCMQSPYAHNLYRSGWTLPVVQYLVTASGAAPSPKPLEPSAPKGMSLGEAKTLLCMFVQRY